MDINILKILLVNRVESLTKAMSNAYQTGDIEMYLKIELEINNTNEILNKLNQPGQSVE